MKLTDTHLVLLSAAAQRPDRAVLLAPERKDSVANKVLGRLLREQLLEEIPASGSLPAWRRDDNKGPLALRITDSALEAIGVQIAERQATAEFAVATEANAKDLQRLAALGEQHNGTSSRRPANNKSNRAKQTNRQTRKPIVKQIGAASKSAVRSKPMKSDAGSKQSRIIAMLRSSKGATIAAVMEVTGWQQHSVRGFLAGVVRKHLKLNLDSKKVDGDRVYRITGEARRKSAARRQPNRESA